MKATGTLISYYFICQRKAYLFYHRINLEDNSENVHIGKALHETKFEDEIKFENIALDKITEEYIIEFKKSSSDTQAAKFQLLFYLKTLKDIGIIRKGRLEFSEKRGGKSKQIIVELTKDNENELRKVCKDLQNLVSLEFPPKALQLPKCKNCAYFTYCFI